MCVCVCVCVCVCARARARARASDFGVKKAFCVCVCVCVYCAYVRGCVCEKETARAAGWVRAWMRGGKGGGDVMGGDWRGAARQRVWNRLASGLRAEGTKYT